MSRKKRLVVGLGNPGDEYAQTRHNIGFVVVDSIAEKAGIAFEKEDEGFMDRLGSLFLHSAISLETSGSFRGAPFVLLKPMTYMNRSGQVVKRVCNRLQLDPSDIVVVFDDISLPCGSVRIRKSGGAGGHNGVQDIIDELGTDQFPRIRVGIGNAFDRGGQSDYVLSPFSADQVEEIASAVKTSVDAALCFVRDGLMAAMNRYNRKPLSKTDSDAESNAE